MKVAWLACAAAMGCGKAKPPPRAARPLPVREREDLSRRSQQWHWIRTAPLSAVPAGAYHRGLQAWGSLPAADTLTGFRLPSIPRRTAPDLGPAWAQVGPAPLDETPVFVNAGIGAGRMTALAIDPTNSLVLYAGYALGGVWKSTDGGATWAPLTDAQASLAVGAIAIDPAHPLTIYVGTGEANQSGDSYYGHGVLKSTDGGVTWTLVGGTTFSDMAFSQLGVDPVSGKIYATTTQAYVLNDPCASTTNYNGTGFFVSADGGNTWTRLAAGTWSGFSIDWTVSPHVFLLTAPYSPLSQFNEQTGALTGIGNLPGAPYGMAVARGLTAGRLYAGVGSTGAGTLYTSANGGTSWTQVPGAPNFCTQQCNYDDIVTAHPTAADTLYFGGALCPIWKGSGLSGASPVFTALSMPGGACSAQWWMSSIHADNHVILFDPKDATTLYVGTDNGLVRTRNDGASWEHLAQGTATSQFYGLCADPVDPTILYGGFQDSGDAQTTSTAGLWREVQTGDGGPCLTHPTRTNVLVTTENATVWKTTDGFNSAFTNPVFSVLPPTCTALGACSDRSAFTMIPLVADPAQPNTVYLGTHRVWKSTNFGDTFTALTGDLTAGPSGLACTGQGGQADYLSAITASGNLLYTGSAGGVLTKLANDGTGAAIISKAPLPARYVTGIAVDPANPQVLYVSYGGFNAGTPTRPGHVFRSSDGGGTWAAVDPAGWDAPIYTLVPHATRSGVLFAGTDFGVLATPNAGAAWGQLGSGFPNVTVTSMVFHAASNRLIAGTHGRSAFSLQLPSTNATITSVTPSTGSTLGGEKVTVQGTGLEDGVLLTFGGASATKVTPASATSVTAIVPAHAAGAVDVAATNLDGSGALDAAAFTYVAPPAAIPEPIGPEAKVGCGCAAAPAPWWALAALLLVPRSPRAESRGPRRCA